MIEDFPFPRLSVIVAEDEILTRLAVVDELLENGFDVREACNADEALTVLESEKTHVDALFTDIDMPGSMNGLELALRARQSRPHLGVLIASGKHRVSNDFVLARSRFVAKPYDVAEIPQILHGLVEI
jgi:two-component system, response regulator PdtaR